MSLNTEEVQERARRFVAENVLCNQSYLVQHLLKEEIISYDDIQNVYVNASDWSIEKCRDWLDSNNENYPDGKYNPAGLDDDEIREALKELNLEVALAEFDAADVPTGEANERSAARSQNAAEAILAEYDLLEDEDALRAWRDAVTESNTGQEANEAYEWWVVTPYMLQKLSELGEIIIDSDKLGESWWGRSCTGQAIYLDYTIQQIIES